MFSTLAGLDYVSAFNRLDSARSYADLFRTMDAAWTRLWRKNADGTVLRRRALEKLYEFDGWVRLPDELAGAVFAKTKPRWGRMDKFRILIGRVNQPDFFDRVYEFNGWRSDFSHKEGAKKQSISWQLKAALEDWNNPAMGDNKRLEPGFDLISKRLDGRKAVGAKAKVKNTRNAADNLVLTALAKLLVRPDTRMASRQCPPLYWVLSKSAKPLAREIIWCADTSPKDAFIFASGEWVSWDGNSVKEAPWMWDARAVPYKPSMCGAAAARGLIELVQDHKLIPVINQLDCTFDTLGGLGPDRYRVPFGENYYFTVNGSDYGLHTHSAAMGGNSAGSNKLSLFDLDQIQVIAAWHEAGGYFRRGYKTMKVQLDWGGVFGGRPLKWHPQELAELEKAGIEGARLMAYPGGEYDYTAALASYFKP